MQGALRWWPLERRPPSISGRYDLTWFTGNSTVWFSLSGFKLCLYVIFVSDFLLNVLTPPAPLGSANLCWLLWRITSTSQLYRYTVLSCILDRLIEFLRITESLMELSLGFPIYMPTSTWRLMQVRCRQLPPWLRPKEYLGWADCAIFSASISLYVSVTIFRRIMRTAKKILKSSSFHATGQKGCMYTTTAINV